MELMPVSWLHARMMQASMNGTMYLRRSSDSLIFAPVEVFAFSAAAVAAMRSLGTRPADVIAGIGPAVAPDCYQIGPEVAEAATRAFGDRAPDVLRATGPGQWQFDLWMANRLVLTEAGIPGDQIQASNVPTGPIPATDPSGPISNTGFSGPITATDPSGSTGPAGGPFFSHRAERPCGRFAAMACLRARQALRPGEAR